MTTALIPLPTLSGRLSATLVPLTATPRRETLIAAHGGLGRLASGIQPLDGVARRRHHDFGHVPLLTLLVLPGPGAKRPLDIDQPALGQIVVAELRRPAKHLDPVPFGAFLLVAVPILEGFVRSHGQLGHGTARRQIRQLGVLAKPTDKNDFIDTPGHGTSPSFGLKGFGKRTEPYGNPSERVSLAVSMTAN